MADVRIKDLVTETTTLSDGSYVLLDDGSTSKYDLNNLQEQITDNAVSMTFNSTTKTLTVTIGG